MTMPLFYRRTRAPGPINGVAMPGDVGSIPDMAFWCSADDISGNDGDAIATWYGKTTVTNNLTQTTEAQKPILKKNIINGHAVARFDGSDDNMVFGTALTANPFHLFVVAKYNATGRVIVSGGGGALRVLLGLIAGDNAISIIKSGAVVLGTSSNTLNNASFNLITLYYSNPNYGFRFNGVDAGTGSNAQTMNPATHVSKSDYGEYWNGDIAELIVFNRALSGGEFTTVEDYLAGKYAL